MATITVRVLLPPPLLAVRAAGSSAASDTRSIYQGHRLPLTLEPEPVQITTVLALLVHPRLHSLSATFDIRSFAATRAGVLMFHHWENGGKTLFGTSRLLGNSPVTGCTMQY